MSRLRPRRSAPPPVRDPGARRLVRQLFLLVVLAAALVVGLVWLGLHIILTAPASKSAPGADHLHTRMAPYRDTSG